MPIDKLDLRPGPGGVYYVHWSEGSRSKRKSLGTRSELEARARRDAWAKARREGEDAAAAGLTVADLWDRYVRGHAVTAEASRAYAWNNLQIEFGELGAHQLDHDAVERYGAKRRAGTIGKRPAKDATIRRELAMLRACFAWCANPRRKLVAAEDIQPFDLPPPGEARDRWLQPAEIERLMTAARELRGGERLSRVERFLALALETAARREAIQNLTWDRVDFETGMIQYREPGRRVTKKRRASVPMSRTLRPILERAWKERTGPFVLDTAGPVRVELQRACRAAGFGTGEKYEGTKKLKDTDVSPHVLRHTAATLMARRGVPLWQIAGVLGNTIAVVEKVYAKHTPDGLREAVDAISGGGRLAAE